MIGITNSIESKKFINSYIKNGLILQFDGIQNTRNGHNGNTRNWEDLSGNGWDLVDAYGGGYSVLEKCYSFPSSGALKFTTAYNIIPKVVEFVFLVSANDASENYGISGWSNAWPTLYSLNRKICFGNGQMVADFLTYNQIHTMSFTLSTKKVYKDGQNYTTTTGASSNSYSSTTRNIGGYSSINNYSWNGNIYAIRFYDRDLTEEEILHNQQLDIKRFDILA